METGLLSRTLVGDDLCVEAGGLELVEDVDGGIVVLFGAGPVGGFGEDLEVLAGECGVWNGLEAGVNL